MPRLREAAAHRLAAAPAAPSREYKTVKRISIFDTTLRDGEQAPNNAMSPAQKLALALKIESLGVDAIEGGFPASSPDEFRATRALAQGLTRARLVSFCRASRADVDVALEAGGVSARHGLQILATGSDLHLEHKRRITRAQGIAEVVDTVRFARTCGVSMISVGIEDASRGDLQYLRQLVEASVEAGARNLVVADTTGYATPQEYAELVAHVRRWAPEPIQLATHCHDDFGLALANTVAAIEAGADEAQVTLGGIGERAGNTPIEEFAALLHYKRDLLGCYTDIRLERLYDAYEQLRATIQLDEPRNKAIFGKYAFSTAAGIHQQGVLRNPSTYEYVEPQAFGRDRALVVARHSGRSVLRFLLDELGIATDESRLDELYRAYVTSRPEGDCEDLSVLKERLRNDLLVAA
jgi:2-isopropylmalate synthase